MLSFEMCAMRTGGTADVQAALLHLARHSRDAASSQVQSQLMQHRKQAIQEHQQQQPQQPAAVVAAKAAAPAAAALPALTQLAVGWGWSAASVGVLLRQSEFLTSFTAGVHPVFPLQHLINQPCLFAWYACIQCMKRPMVGLLSSLLSCTYLLPMLSCLCMFVCRVDVAQGKDVAGGRTSQPTCNRNI